MSIESKQENKEKKLRIIITDLDVGGTERHLTYVLPRLVQMGWEIKVISLKGKGALGKSLEAAGIRVQFPSHITTQKMNRFLNHLKTFRYLYREFKHDNKTLTHYFLPQAYIIGALTAWISGFKQKQIMSRRSLNIYQKQYWGLSFIERQLHQHMTAIVGNSQAVIKELAQEQVPASKLFLIYNGVKLPVLDAISRQPTRTLTLNIESDAYVIAILANILPYKGHDDLLRALKKIQDHLPKPWYLLCAGAGSDSLYGNKLRHLTEELGLASHIQWLGACDNLSFLEACDLAVLPSHQEGFSNVILECMAASLPMVVTDVGGNKEAVLHEKTGLVVQPHNEEALSQAILKLATQPKIAEHYGREARKRIETQFSLEFCVGAYHKFYSNLGM